jgi:hypothetical protein
LTFAGILTSEFAVGESESTFIAPSLLSRRLTRLSLLEMSSDFELGFLE